MEFPVTQVTSGPEQHFAGYYDKTPWNQSQRLLCCHRVNVHDRAPTEDDILDIGIIDLDSKRFEKVAGTSAWNWQQGAMLQWSPSDPENSLIFNDRREGRFVSVIHNIRTSEQQVHCRPVAAVSPDGKYALSLNFSRLADMRPGYGYAGIADPWVDDPTPQEDGIHLINLADWECQMVLSVSQIADYDAGKIDKNAKHWFNHLLFSPDAKRFIFLHRWGSADGEFKTRLFTSAIDGSELYCLNDHDVTSHFDWRDNYHVLAFANRFGMGCKYYLFEDRSDNIQVIGDEKLTPLFDGHCSYSPDRKWLLTDTYPDDDRNRLLLVYRPEDDTRIDLGTFYEKESISGDLRCDLHPKWSRDGRLICFDSMHPGSRQVFVIDVSGGEVDEN